MVYRKVLPSLAARVSSSAPGLLVAVRTVALGTGSVLGIVCAIVLGLMDAGLLTGATVLGKLVALGLLSFGIGYGLEATEMA